MNGDHEVQIARITERINAFGELMDERFRHVEEKLEVIDRRTVVTHDTLDALNIWKAKVVGGAAALGVLSGMLAGLVSALVS